jgi:hydrogenase nickel incorporation protein HypB
VNKVDALSLFDFDIATLRDRVLKINPRIRIFEISAKTGQGIREWADWLRGEVETSVGSAARA